MKGAGTAGIVEGRYSESARATASGSTSGSHGLPHTGTQAAEAKAAVAFFSRLQIRLTDAIHVCSERARASCVLWRSGRVTGGSTALWRAACRRWRAGTMTQSNLRSKSRPDTSCISMDETLGGLCAPPVVPGLHQILQSLSQRTLASSVRGGEFRNYGPHPSDEIDIKHYDEPK